MSTPTLPADATTGTPSGTNGYRARDKGSLELARFLSNPLTYLDGLRDEGRDIAPFKLGNLECHLVCKPELLKQAMHNEDWPPISRGRLMGLTKWYTEGLFLTYGPEHHRQRDEIWKPLFEDAAIPEIAVDRTARRANEWAEGQPIEMYKELRSLCWAIDWEALTGSDLDQAPDMHEALGLGVDALAWLVLPFGPARWNWPVPQSRRTREASQRLDSTINLMISERRARGGDGTLADGRVDLLTQLVRQADAPGSVTTDGQIRATFKMWFGADQLHAMFTWTLQLLADNPEVEKRWHAELDEVLGGRTITAADIPSLPYTRRVLMESMRIMPPVWGFFRQMTSDYKLGDEVIPEGHLMAMSPWATHRDPKVWPDPLRFDPERWAPGAERPPELSYFPFSAGPYECHGQALAMKEAVLILATLGQRWSYRPVAKKAPKPMATWATEPRKGLHMTPVRRGA